MPPKRWWKRKRLWMSIFVVSLIFLILKFTPVLTWYNDAQPQTQAGWVAALASLISAGIAGTVTMYTVKVTQEKAQENLSINLVEQNKRHEEEIRQRKLDRTFETRQQAASALYGMLIQVINIDYLDDGTPFTPEMEDIYQSAASISLMFGKRTGQLALHCADLAGRVQHFAGMYTAQKKHSRDLEITLTRSESFKPGEREKYQEEKDNLDNQLTKESLNNYRESQASLNGALDELVREIQKALEIL